MVSNLIFLGQTSVWLPNSVLCRMSQVIWTWLCPVKRYLQKQVAGIFGLLTSASTSTLGTLPTISVWTASSAYFWSCYENFRVRAPLLRVSTKHSLLFKNLLSSEDVKLHRIVLVSRWFANYLAQILDKSGLHFANQNYRYGSNPRSTWVLGICLRESLLMTAVSTGTLNNLPRLEILRCPES